MPISRINTLLTVWGLLLCIADEPGLSNRSDFEWTPAIAASSERQEDKPERTQVDTAERPGTDREEPTQFAPRMVDQLPVPPFGFSLRSVNGSGFRPSNGRLFTRLATWPEPAAKPAAADPLAFENWRHGPYKNAAGKRWADRINSWYREGTSAGLTQDTFRSYDRGHSGLQPIAFPQMRFEEPVSEIGPPWERIFQPRVTMGVQSYGLDGKSMIETRSRLILRKFYEPNQSVPPFQEFYKLFYENNFLFVSPAVHSYKPENDTFAFLSPYYLHSIGASGTDARLLRPLVLASAALPPDLKTRMLKEGLFVPSLMYLFKSHIAGDIQSPNAHVPAYSLPEEAEEAFDGPTPFLDNLLNSAYGLDHIPPVCRLRVDDVLLEAKGSHSYAQQVYYEDTTYAFTGAVRAGQTLVLTIDLRFSWTDGNRPITQYVTSVLRGEGSITRLNEEGSVLKISIPCMLTNKRNDLRTDVLLLVHDGSYFSAPAYVSLRHLDRFDPITLGIKADRSDSVKAPTQAQ